MSTMSVCMYVSQYKSNKFYMNRLHLGLCITLHSVHFKGENLENLYWERVKCRLRSIETREWKREREREIQVKVWYILLICLYVLKYIQPIYIHTYIYQNDHSRWNVLDTIAKNNALLFGCRPLNWITCILRTHLHMNNKCT